MDANWKGRNNMSQELEKMCEQIRKDGVLEPKIGVVTPEIRTIDERVIYNVNFINSAREIDKEK